MEKHTASGTNNERWQKKGEVWELVTSTQLQLIDPLIKITAVETFLPYINRYCLQYEIDTPQRVAAFLGQILVESGHLRYVREIWGPTTQQRKYERDFREPWHANLKQGDRNYLAYMLGNTEAGDGNFFKGHALIQITGRANHRACSLALFGDLRLLRNPELLTVPEYAVQAACWYFQWKKLYKALDTPDVKDETRGVNGGLTALEERKAIYEKAIEILAA